jgi:hypothetical protein
VPQHTLCLSTPTLTLQVRVNTISAGPLGSRAAKAIGFIDDMIRYSYANAPIQKELAAKVGYVLFCLGVGGMWETGLGELQLRKRTHPEGARGKGGLSLSCGVVGGCPVCIVGVCVVGVFVSVTNAPAQRP